MTEPLSYQKKPLEAKLKSVVAIDPMVLVDLLNFLTNGDTQQVSVALNLSKLCLKNVI